MFFTVTPTSFRSICPNVQIHLLFYCLTFLYFEPLSYYKPLHYKPASSSGQLTHRKDCIYITYDKWYFTPKMGDTVFYCKATHNQLYHYNDSVRFARRRVCTSRDYLQKSIFSQMTDLQILCNVIY